MQLEEYFSSSIGAAIEIIKTVKSAVPAQTWEQMDYVLGSKPLLMTNGSIPENVLKNQSSFYTVRHPRTALCVLPNGDWLLLVADGRQAISEGLSLAELALYLKKQGCNSAINLDGGGSSTLVIDQELVNSPSGREHSWYIGKRAERPIAIALIVQPTSEG